MDRNTYKSQKKKGVFAYLARKTHWQYPSFPGLPGHYVPILLFIFCIGIFYVGSTHYYERMLRKISRLEREVDALRVDYTTLQAGYMFDSKRSEVARRVAHLGLYEAPHPPLKIKRK